VLTIELSFQSNTLIEHSIGQRDQWVDFDCPRQRGGTQNRGLELQGAHATRPGVAKALDRSETPWGTTAGRQPRIDEGAAESVGQTVGEHSGKALERHTRERGELVGRPAEWHLKW